jgi:hypothetical protein
MERDLDTPEDTPLWVFSLVEEQQGQVPQMVDIGMGGHVLESTIEPLLASRATGSVKLSEPCIDFEYSTLLTVKMLLS